jgi:hypothetical protein
MAGFLMPSFVVDLPGGGGKRLAASHESYDRETGRSTFVAPSVTGRDGGKKERVYEYWDPVVFTGMGKKAAELGEVKGGDREVGGEVRGRSSD